MSFRIGPCDDVNKYEMSDTVQQLFSYLIKYYKRYISGVASFITTDEQLQ